MSHNHNHDHNHDHEHDYITLVLDDGEEVECQVIGTFEVEDIEYIALLPEDVEEVYIYRFSEDENGIDLKNIEDDEEFEIVKEAFYALFGDDEYYDDYDEEYDDEDEE